MDVRRISRVLHFMGLVGLSACSFDAGGLAARLCSEDSECASGACVDGVCRIDPGGGDLDGSNQDAVGGDEDADAMDAVGDADTGVSQDVILEDVGEPDVLPDTGCEPGQRFCDDGVAWLCSAEGERELEEDCSLPTCGDGAGCACVEGVCESRVCEPGRSTCVDLQTVSTCEADGLDAPVESACDEGSACLGGACVEDRCAPNESRCEGEIAVQCDADGRFGQVLECSQRGAYCDDGACVPRVCEPGDFACAADVDLAGNAIATCSPRGDEWAVTSACGINNVCVDGECLPLVCAPGSAVCSVDGRSVDACNGTGTARAPEECGVGRYCRSIDASCVEQACEPGQVRCRNTQQVETCNALGSGYAPATTCEGGTICVEGGCIDTLCPPGRAYCADEGTAAVCSEEGDEVLSTEACPFGCRDGECVDSFCGDGIVDPANGELCDDGNDDPCDGCHGCQPTNGLQLDGSVRVTSNARWVPGRGSFTFEAWVNVLSENGALFGLGESSDSDSVLMRVTGGVPIFSYRNNSNAIIRVIGRERITGAGWVHLAGVRFDEREAALYVNGRLQSVTSLDTRQRSIDSTQGRIWVGTDGSLDRSAATLDELRLSNTVRYTSDFAPSPRHETDASTIALYRFDQYASGVVRAVNGSRDLTLADATFVNTGCFGATAETYLCGDGGRAPWEGCDSTAESCVACRPASRCAHDLRFDGAGTAAGGCYMAVTSSVSWEAAQRACSAWGGHLATVDNAAENSWIRALVSGNFWIGLNDRGLTNEGRFSWVSGLNSDYRNWAPGEPNDGGSFFASEDCVEVYGDGRWNDSSCDSNRIAVCERAN
jgi:hypothetical protein